MMISERINLVGVLLFGRAASFRGVYSRHSEILQFRPTHNRVE
jgi:hypothetical protein